MKVEITDDALDAVVIHEMQHIVDRLALDPPTFVLSATERAEDAIVKEAAKVILDYYGGSDADV